jgi:hypothetical protein
MLACKDFIDLPNFSPEVHGQIFDLPSISSLRLAVTLPTASFIVLLTWCIVPSTLSFVFALIYFPICWSTVHINAPCGIWLGSNERVKAKRTIFAQP